MAGEGGERCKSTQAESTTPRALVACFLREVDAANAYVSELHDAVVRKDRRRCATAKAGLHAAWKNARGTLAKLEQLSGHREIHAHALLEQSQVAARPALDALWAFVRI